jgi:glucokinase
VGGGVCRQGEYLLGPVRKMIEEGRYSKYSAKQTQLCVAQLGNDAGIVGAACLGRN